MSNIVLETLQRELRKKQARMKRLEAMMSENHTRRETAQAMDGFARRFNNATTVKEKLNIADDWKETSDLWKKQCAKAKHQNENYMKWMNEQTELQGEAYDLSQEVGLMGFRESLRNPVKPTPEGESK